ncbi:MAG: hypothetical protein Q8R55_05465 [Candidatus Taylorbacteria bacterium]|nr:hypothetical protein [Candidatus Taylorbacteria bacterium]
MERMVLTFREKLGMVLMSLGVAYLIFLSFVSIVTFLSLFLLPVEYFPGETTYRTLLLLAVVAVALIKLSTYTVKK